MAGSPAPVKIAVIGAGQMGQKHGRLVAQSADCRLVGLCDVDPKGSAVATSLGVPFFDDLEALLTDTAADAAIISTPNSAHIDAVEVCAPRGLHVLIEKPIADTRESADRIVALSKRYNIRVLVGHHRRHNPLVQATRSLIQDGRIGDLVGLSMHWALVKPDDYFHIDWRCRRPGGGPNFINLIHECDLARHLSGDIRCVFAYASNSVRHLDVEDTLSINLQFANGALGTILASDATPSPWSYELTTAENPHYFHVEQNCYHFLGTRGSLAFPRMEFWHYDGGQAGWQHDLELDVHEVETVDPLERQLAHFCAVVRGEEPPLVDAKDAAASLNVVLAIQESAASGQPVEVL